MRDLLNNIGAGALCWINITFAVIGNTVAALTLEEKARVFAGVMTGLWFATQIGLALWDRRRKAKRHRQSNEGLD